MINLNGPSIGKAEIRAVTGVLRSRHLARGTITRTLERTFEKNFFSSYAVVTSSGTAALFSALSALGITTGDEVITTSVSFVATANVIVLCGATPVFVDIDPDSYTLDVSAIARAITKKTKAILTVDLYGHPAFYGPIRKLADKHGLFLISDSCQAIGALYAGKPVTAFADVTVFSFFGSKNITSGEGGVLLTNKRTIADSVNLLINHGQKRGEQYRHLTIGWNFRPTDIQSALIQAQLERLDQINRKRNEHAAYLIRHLSKLKGIVCPANASNVFHTYSRFTICVTKDFPLTRDALKQYLEKNGIQTEIAYGKTLYEYPHLRRYTKGTFPVARRFVSECLCLPIHQHLSKKDMDHVIQTLKNIV